MDKRTHLYLLTSKVWGKELGEGKDSKDIMMMIMMITMMMTMMNKVTMIMNHCYFIVFTPQFAFTWFNLWNEKKSTMKIEIIIKNEMKLEQEPCIRSVVASKLLYTESWVEKSVDRRALLFLEARSSLSHSTVSHRLAKQFSSLTSLLQSTAWAPDHLEHARFSLSSWKMTSQRRVHCNSISQRLKDIFLFDEGVISGFSRAHFE